MQRHTESAQTHLSRFRWCLALAAAGLIAAPVLAQRAQAPAPPAPAAVSQIPERTTASYGDWTLLCERPATPVGAQRICEIAQSIQLQGQQAPIAQLAIGRAQKADPLKLTIVRHCQRKIGLPQAARVASRVA